VAASRLALHGGAPVRGPDKSWPAWPVFDDAERRALNETLESCAWWYGERVAAFEGAFAAFQGAAHCVSCTSGTTAGEIAIQAMDIAPGDEVIVPPYTFIATATCVARMGGTPVFVDVDDAWNLNADLIDAAITPRTRAIMPVHFSGRVCDMDRINAIAARHGAAVIEDACHAWGATYQGKGAGTLGKAGIFSFQMSKNITAGEGGAIVTDDPDFAEVCRSITHCGRGSDSAWYGHVRVGTNARLTEFQAAVLNAQLGRLEEQTIRRERNGERLAAVLAQVEGLTPQPGDPRITRRAYHLFCLRIDPERFGCSRDAFVRAAEAEGLPIGAGYGMPIYHQQAFRSGRFAGRYDAVSCPVAEDLCYRSGMWFSHQLLLGDEADIADIIEIVHKIKANAAALRAMDADEE